MIIPFFIPHSGCPHQCVFCNQKRITGSKSGAEPASMARTIKSYLDTHYKKKTGVLDATRNPHCETAPQDRSVHGNREHDPVQIGFYGGSFTALPQEAQKQYLEAVRPFLRSGAVQSIRLSTRPDYIAPGILELLKEHGVETVELGAQSMNDAVLSLSGRGHTASATERAVRMLREFSFMIGLQLMPGLPGDSPEIFIDTVARTISLKPDFVRLYPSLVIKETPLERLYNAGRYTPLSLDEAVALCKKALLSFESAGIAVIRIGLQPTKELEKPGTIVAGPFHPAFRQIVECSVLLDCMVSALANRKTGSDGATFFVNPADISNAAGQHRSNIKTLKKQFGLKTIRLQPRKDIPLRTATLAAL